MAVFEENVEAPFLSDEEFKATATAMAEHCRDSFPAFMAFIHPPGHSTYILGRLHMYLASIVQACIDGTSSPRQAVSVPPQHGKSRLLAVRAVAWVIGHVPGIHIALTGFSYSLLVGFVSEVRVIMSSPQYAAVFPEVHSVRGKDRQDNAEFSNGSSIIVKTCGAKLIGRRVDWLIIDDAHAGRSEAESKTIRDKILQWYFADCVSRLSRNAKVFVIGTRWHPEDLIGKLTDEEYVKGLVMAGQEQEIFNVTNIPAIADHNPDIGEECPLGREPGEAVFPEERPLSFLQAIKASIPAYEWDSQYMGRPRAAGSGQIDTSKIRRIFIGDIPTDIPWVRGWDLALTEKQTSDFSVGALCAFDKRTDEFYIINIWRKKLAWAKLKPQLIARALLDKELYGSNLMGLEAVSGFDIGLSELRSQLLGEVVIHKKNPPPGGKLMRAMDWLNAIEARRVYMVEAPWNKEFLDELHPFPYGTHDDQADAVSIAWETTARKSTLLFA